MTWTSSCTSCESVRCCCMRIGEQSLWGVRMAIEMIIYFNWLVSSAPTPSRPRYIDRISLATVQSIGSFLRIETWSSSLWHGRAWILITRYRGIRRQPGSAENLLNSAHCSRSLSTWITHQQLTRGAFWCCSVSRYNLLNAQAQCKQCRRAYWVPSVIKPHTFVCTENGHLFALYEINLLSLVAWISHNFAIILLASVGWVASPSIFHKLGLTTLVKTWMDGQQSVSRVR